LEKGKGHKVKKLKICNQKSKSSIQNLNCLKLLRN